MDKLAYIGLKIMKVIIIAPLGLHCSLNKDGYISVFQEGKGITFIRGFGH